MNVSVEETGPVERRLHIEIPTTDVDAAFAPYFREMRRSAHIRASGPARRRARCSRSTSATAPRGEVLQRLVERHAVQGDRATQNLDVLGEPRLDAGELPKPGARYAYDADVDVRPAIELATGRRASR